MKTKVEIENQLYELLSSLGIASQNDDGTYSIQSEDIDSVQMISTLVEIEELFGIEFPSEYLVSDFLAEFEHVVDAVYELSNK